MSAKFILYAFILIIFFFFYNNSMTFNLTPLP